MVKIAPFGTWSSPISAADVAAAGRGPQWVDLHRGRVWWAEHRPTEGGRITLLRTDAHGSPEELPSAPWNLRNRVHEYGGRAWTVLDAPDGELVAFQAALEAELSFYGQVFGFTAPEVPVLELRR